MVKKQANKASKQASEQTNKKQTPDILQAEKLLKGAK